MAAGPFTQTWVHTDETFSEPLFLNHVWAGLYYVMGGDAPAALDYSKSKPEENRFSKVVLAEKLNEPMELSVLNDGRILFIERHGAVKLFNLKTKQVKTIANIAVSTKYKDKEGKTSEAEDGLLGLNKDPNFATNHWIYLYYSDPVKSENILTRYTLKGDVLDLNSKKLILEVPTQREQCCHTGGSIAWDKGGNLYLSTGETQVQEQLLMHLLMNVKEDHHGTHKNLLPTQMICVERYYA